MKTLTRGLARSGALLICVPACAISASSDAVFIAQMTAAMTRMMSDMNVSPSGNVDVDFVAEMTPHHRGAIDMAVAELRYGTNQQLRRIAQEIIITQRDEIVAMRLALKSAQ